MTVTLSWSSTDGLEISSEALSLLMGISAEEAQCLAAANAMGLDTPTEWSMAARRRVREAAAHTGADSLLRVLEYWALKDRGAKLEVIYADEMAKSAKF